MSTVPAKQFVTMYSVQFRGLFGRNRSAKFYSSQADTICREEEPNTAWLTTLCEKELSIIKAKQGTAKVVRYRDCESLTSPDSRGNMVTSYIIPITQGETVFTKQVG